MVKGLCVAYREGTFIGIVLLTLPVTTRSIAAIHSFVTFLVSVSSLYCKVLSTLAMQWASI